MIKEFCYQFDELEITKTDINELMGFEDDAIPEPFPHLIEQALKKAPHICNIRGGYKIFNSIEINPEKESLSINQHIFNPSKIVITQFKDASSFALFICTAGNELSDYAKELSLNGDPILSYVFDVIGSITVEKATDKLQNWLEEDCKKRGHGISDRFSPGYCEWSVSEQQMLFDLMPDGFCGVTLSESSLMSPIKSVSGIIAIGKGLKQKGYQCNWCNDKNCIYGRIKRQKK